MKITFDGVDKNVSSLYLNRLVSKLDAKSIDKNLELYYEHISSFFKDYVDKEFLLFQKNIFSSWNLSDDVKFDSLKFNSVNLIGIYISLDFNSDTQSKYSKHFSTNSIVGFKDGVFYYSSSLNETNIIPMNTLLVSKDKLAKASQLELNTGIYLPKSLTYVVDSFSSNKLKY